MYDLDKIRIDVGKLLQSRK